MRARLLVLGVMVMCMLPAAARADQVVVFDETWVHAPDIPDSHHNATPTPETPASWTSPVDYSQGTAWVYLEVFSKPTEQETKFQVCFNSSPTYACTDQSPTYTTTGTIEWATPVTNFWHPPENNPDWSLGISGLSAIFKDTMNNKPSADNVGDEVAALYMPTEVRMVVTLVSPGGEYVPPTPTGEDTTTGDSTTTGDTTTTDTTAGPASTTSDAATTGTSDPTPQTTGATSSSDDPNMCAPGGSEYPCCESESMCLPATASETYSSGDAETTGTTTAPPATTDDDPSGCACSSTPSGAAGSLVALLLLGLPRRRPR